MDSLRVKSGGRRFYFDKVNNQFHPCDKMSWIQLEGHWGDFTKPGTEAGTQLVLFRGDQMVEDYTSPKFPEGATFQQTATDAVVAHGNGYEVTYGANSNDGSISSSVKNPDAFDKVPQGVAMKNAAGYDEEFSAEEAQRD